MAIQIPVSATADDRTFQQIANRYEKWGKDTGKKIGAGLAEGIDDPKIEKAFSRVGDAMSKVRAEEAKLQDLRQRGASDSRITVQSEALARARTAEARATNDAIRAYDGMATSTSRLSAATGTLTGVLSGTRFGALAADVSNLSSKFGSLGAVTGGTVLGVTAIGTAAIVVGKQLYDMGAAWDNTVDSITGKTGLVGSQLNELTGTIKNLAAVTALPVESIGNIAGQVSQSLNLSGDAAAKMIQTLAQIQQLTGQGVDTRGLGKAFSLFGVDDIDSQTGAVEDLLRVSQATGLGINELVSAVQQGGKAAKEFGLDFSDTAGLIATMQDAGLDFTRTAPSLSIALKNFAKDGREPQQALRDTISEIKALTDAQQDAAAIDLAQKTFGRGYVDFLNAIKDGHLTVDSLTAALDKSGASLQAQIAATEDWTEEWTKLSNRLTTEFEPTASLVFSTVGHYIEDYLFAPLRGVQGLVNMFGPGGGGPGSPGTPTPITQGSPLGNLLLGAPGAAQGTGLGDILRGGPGSPGPAGPLGLWDTQRQVAAGAGDSFKGATTLWDKWSDKPKPGDGPTMPVLPTTGDPMSLLQGFTPTSSLYGAAESVITARNARAQAESDLHTLEQSNVATAEQIQTAKNKLAKTDGDIYQAEMRLNEAKIASTDKLASQLKSATGALDELGAGLDRDLGISKGLAGIADNIVRFVGNLAAAPLLGQLNAISQAQGGINATGSGLIGIAASQGAFGPQYQIAGYDQNGNPVSAAQAGSQPLFSSAAQAAQQGQGGGAVGASISARANALTGQSARDFAHETMMPFWQSQGLTVGDHAADKYGEHQNGALDIMVDSIAEGNKVLKEVLSDPNVYGAIFNNQTYGYGHGLTPQPYGSTGGPTDRHEDHVHAWYKPGGENNITPVPTGGPTDPYRSPATSPAPQRRPTAGPPLSVLPGSGPGSASPGTWPFTSYDDGGELPPGTTVVQNNTGRSEHIVNPQGMVGSTPASQIPSIMGPNIAGGPGGGGPAPGPSPIGGNEAKAVPGGGQSGGGAVGAATGAAAMAADMFAPGSGAAVQIASQEIQRAIKFGAQATAIGVGGLMQTFLPTGASDLANNSWITRIAGGFAGVAPQIPNLAGKSASVDAMKQNQQTAPAMAMPPPLSSGQGAGPAPGPAPQVTNHITWNGSGAANDPDAADLADHLTRRYENTPGKR